ncbi:MAG: response regulator [Vicinamibacterales bacterium]
MSSFAAPDTNAPTLPPIVLFVEDDRDVLDMYTAFFESDGMWITTALTPDDGHGAIEEMKPDLVITDIGFDGHPTGIDFVHDLKSQPEMRDIPLIVLSGLPLHDLPPALRHGSDLFLRKPVAADALMLNVRRLLESSHALRARSDRTRARVSELLETSAGLRERGHESRGRVFQRVPRCPGCDRSLSWLENQLLNGVEYEYYERCAGGCGLYCRARGSARWIKLA